MMLCELYQKQNLLHLPKIEKLSFQLLWYSDYWDGPKSGMLLYQGRKRWFQIFDESDESEDYYRHFVIIELTKTQLDEEEYWHKLFREKVGTHTDYDKTGKWSVNNLQPQEIWHEFYNAYENRKPQDFSDNLVLAWFEL